LAYSALPQKRQAPWTSHSRARAVRASACSGQSCSVAGSKSAPLGHTNVRFSRHGRANEWLRSGSRVPRRIRRGGRGPCLPGKKTNAVRPAGREPRRTRPLAHVIHLPCHALKTPWSGAEPREGPFSPTDSAEAPLSCGTYLRRPSPRAQWGAGGARVRSRAIGQRTARPPGSVPEDQGEFMR